jgi:two-component system, chemotaxis family, sensor kinase CheA
MKDDFSQAFKDEARELLGDLEDSLLEMEENPEDLGIVSRVFRTMHTIKGSGAMFGYDDIASFTHNVETVYDLVRSGEVKVSKELVSLSLAARDRILEMLEASETGVAVDYALNEQVIEGFRRFLPSRGADGEACPDKVSETAGSQEAAAKRTYRIRFRPHREILSRGTNPLSLLRELHDLGVCTTVAHPAAIQTLDNLDPEECLFFWDIILTTEQGEDQIRDVFIFIEDDCELTIALIDDGSDQDGQGGHKKLGEILVERGDLTVEQMEEALGRQKRFGELVIEAGLVDVDTVTSALMEQKHVKEVRQERQPQASEATSSIRVTAEKLDVLVNLVGELVTVQARLSLVAQELKRHPELVSVAEEVERLTNDLRDNALDIRMLPIGATFSKFKRLVRDLSGELGKVIELTTEGAETELDKTVIEKLNDPLVHIIRNSIDHGIETPAQREAKGKSSSGTLHLSAVHSGDSVLITIRDDGAGLNVEAIRAKAIERKLILPTAELTEKEICGLIFAPGFSTASKVTSVSGRGVGMDVVKQAIDGLRGSIEVESKLNVGTTITLRIPLTLAIIESLLVQIGKDRFVLPLSMVDECILLGKEDIARSHGREILQVRGNAVPYVPLRKKFKIEGAAPAIQQVVICQVQGKRIGFVVDWVIGEHQTVIKSLGRMYQNVDGVSGATILGDGSVALILDIPAIIQAAEQEAR